MDDIFSNYLRIYFVSLILDSKNSKVREGSSGQKPHKCSSSKGFSQNQYFVFFKNSTKEMKAIQISFSQADSLDGVKINDIISSKTWDYTNLCFSSISECCQHHFFFLPTLNLFFCSQPQKKIYSLVKKMLDFRSQFFFSTFTGWIYHLLMKVSFLEMGEGAVVRTYS